MTRRQIALEVMAWTLTGLIFMLFLLAGIPKLGDTSGWTNKFQHWGFPIWFRVAIGVIETAGAIVLLWPRIASYAALALAMVMLGAIGTVLRAGDTGSLAQPIVALLLLCFVAALRWRKRYQPWSHSAISAPSSLS